MDEFDQADRVAEAERAGGIARASQALGGTGRIICACGAEISDARRKALPQADTCIDCATFLERPIRKRALWKK